MKLNILIFFTVPLVQHLHDASSSSAPSQDEPATNSHRCLPTAPVFCRRVWVGRRIQTGPLVAAR